MSTSTPTPSAEATPPDPDSLSTDPAVPTCCGRRAVLRAAGLVALTGGTVALAACSADSSSSGTPSAGAGSTEPSAAPSSAAASPSDSASSEPSQQASSAAAPEGTPVPISEVAVGGGVIVQEKFVVTQPTSGEFKAFSAICTHQGCPVGSIEDGQIICPCHMSHFDISTGDPTSGPAQEPLPAVQFTKSGDTIYVSA